MVESSWRQSAATRLFGIDLPIVLAPFGGLSSVTLTAAVSEAGGLGSLRAVRVRPRQNHPDRS